MPNAAAKNSALHHPSHNSTVEHIPRPPNAWILFLQDRARSKTRQKGNFPQCCSVEWNNKTDDEQQVYYVRAEEKKIEHARLYPDYIFQPRRNKATDRDDGVSTSRPLNVDSSFPQTVITPHTLRNPLDAEMNRSTRCRPISLPGSDESSSPTSRGSAPLVTKDSAAQDLYSSLQLLIDCTCDISLLTDIQPFDVICDNPGLSDSGVALITTRPHLPSVPYTTGNKGVNTSPRHKRRSNQSLPAAICQ
ncbi:hypothetical protein BDP27DRAFT_1416975 [Rhodocollybia butyracea]|uniref:HMG box domain-containing protein n=1 Tax=Rhodocollybia butyracea TaxID=206335 RepID=A0A9P5UBW3_9AGAR|nr:hypothetical protein BDP27DRAFT_1416975 [Rhodocollybia butyracea]